MNYFSPSKVAETIRSFWWLIALGVILGATATSVSSSPSVAQEANLTFVDAPAVRAVNQVLDLSVNLPRTEPSRISRELQSEEFRQASKKAAPRAQAIYAQADNRIKVSVRASSIGEARRLIDFVVKRARTLRTLPEGVIQSTEREQARKVRRLEAELSGITKRLELLPGDGGESRSLVTDYAAVQKELRTYRSGLEAFRRSATLDAVGMSVQIDRPNESRTSVPLLVGFGGVLGGGLAGAASLLITGRRRRISSRADIERATVPGALVAVVARSEPIDEFFVEALRRIGHDAGAIELVPVPAESGPGAAKLLLTRVPATSGLNVRLRGETPPDSAQPSDAVSLLVLDAKNPASAYELRRELLRRTDAGCTVRGVVVVVPTVKESLRWY